MPEVSSATPLSVKVGTEDFRTFIEGGYYYVDKTRFIKTILEGSDDTFLILRPRRFGKTLMMSTLAYFLEQNYAKPGDTSAQQELFKGLEICKDEDFCRRNMGQHPVVSITLKSIDAISYPKAYTALVSLVRDLFDRFKWLLNSSRLDDDDREDFVKVRDLPFEPSDEGERRISDSLKKLCHLIFKHCGRKAVLLIDEYDVPLQKAAMNGYYKEMSNVISPMLGNVLKTNPELKKGILTGCLRATKEGIFTILNNFTLNTVLDGDDSLSAAFGFTADEVRAMLSYYGFDDLYERTKASYDGYRFGSQEIFCPWDVTSYVRDLLKPRRDGPASLNPPAYWNNTSNLQIVTEYMPYLKADDADRLSMLLEGRSAEIRINEGMSYGDLKFRRSPDFWNLLVYTGYLTLDKRGTDDVHEFRIPNAEVKKCFRDNVVNYYHDNGDGPYSHEVRKLITSMLSGDPKTAGLVLGKLLSGFVSLRDSATKSPPENFYHGFIDGIFAAAGDELVIDYCSNRESGDGYADITFKSQDQDTGVVLELKHADSLRDLGRDARQALCQIEEKNYGEELAYDCTGRICAYGIAFFRRRCAICFKELRH
ncbi:MAG: AAA family ATPase [Succinivibrio sp.]|nr:AAA family ATPase [Succinivibrio sp.]